MRGRGINYDTGFFPGGKDSRPGFAAETARRELRVIAEDLHCTAVRISGGDPERLAVAARYAAEAGLEVWFAPFPCELTTAELLPFFVDCAERAEQVRLTGAEVVFVTGCELTLFAHGFLDGADSFARINTLMNGGPALWSTLGKLGGRLGAFLAEAVAAVRTAPAARPTRSSAGSPRRSSTRSPRRTALRERRGRHRRRHRGLARIYSGALTTWREAARSPTSGLALCTSS